MSKEIAIEVKNLSKHFRLPTERSSSIKQIFVNFMRGVKGYKEQKVLRDISFNVEKGDFFGIVGRNGSGKSTLLKLISGIYEPDGGTIRVNGSLVSFIELGVGFNPELTGRENVYLNGALLGFSVKEIDEMYDEIVDFAELSEFMDQKLKNYSSGMQVRLAFSCAIRAKSDILVLDEVLAVGDEAFQRKCNDFFTKIREDENKTIVLVTHGMDAVKLYCNKAVMIENGEIVEFGDPTDVANRYILANLQSEETEEDINEEENGEKYKLKIKPTSTQLVNSGTDIKMEISYRLTENDVAKKVFPSIVLLVNGAALVFDNLRDGKISPKIGVNKLTYSYSTENLTDGVEIKAMAELWRPGKSRDSDIKLAYIDNDCAAIFKTTARGRVNGDILRKKGEWRDEKSEK